MAQASTTGMAGFELRMRARRVRTCVDVARRAIENGRTDEARERLREALELEPSNEEAALLAASLAETPPPAQVTSPAPEVQRSTVSPGEAGVSVRARPYAGVEQPVPEGARSAARRQPAAVHLDPPPARPRDKPGHAGPRFVSLIIAALVVLAVILVTVRFVWEWPWLPASTSTAPDVSASDSPLAALITEPTSGLRESRAPSSVPGSSETNTIRSPAQEREVVGSSGAPQPGDMPSPLTTRLSEVDVTPSGDVNPPALTPRSSRQIDRAGAEAGRAPGVTPFETSPRTGNQGGIERQAAEPQPQPPASSRAGITKQGAPEQQHAAGSDPRPGTGAARQPATEQQGSEAAKPPAALANPPAVTSAERRPGAPAAGAVTGKVGATSGVAGSETAGVDARRRADEEAVQRVVQRYVDAYTRLDARMAKSIWPEVDELALGRAFSGLAAQEMVLEKCVVTLDDRQAVAECGGRTTYVTRVGSREPRTDRRRWTFVLRPAGDSWLISAVNAR